jgi:AhpD family alkylhydroperoxidase
MSTEPATVVMVEYENASDEVREVFDDIMATKQIGFVPNAWKVFASHPPTLKRLWYGLKEVMAPGALDPKFKEMIAVAVSVTNGCDYCTRSHTGAARKLGMTDAEYGELLAVVGMFNQTNALAEAYKIPVDDVFLRPWSDPQER